MTIFGIIGLIIIGAFAGLFAQALYGNNGPKGCINTIALGIAGSVLGGGIGGVAGCGDGRPGGFILATLGAVLILIVYQQIEIRRR